MSAIQMFQSIFHLFLVFLSSTLKKQTLAGLSFHQVKSLRFKQFLFILIFPKYPYFLLALSIFLKESLYLGWATWGRSRNTSVEKALNLQRIVRVHSVHLQPPTRSPQATPLYNSFLFLELCLIFWEAL